MLTLILALTCSAAIFALVTATMSWIAAVFPAVIALGVTYFVIARQIHKQIEQQTAQIQRLLQQRQLPGAIQRIKQIQQRYSKWQLFLASSLDGEIGMLYYLQRDFTRAQPHLQRAFIRHFMSKILLGVLYHRAKQYDKMNATFKRAAWYNPKQGLLWSVWAYCLWKQGQTQQAVDVLLQAKHKLGSADPHVTANLLQLQNGKKMKMRGYGNAWYQLQFETPVAMQQPMHRAQRMRHV
ncbi:MAG: hypothetical protein AAF310_04540 [Myxococcota bacterium]